jgi:hypothetical protein
MWEVMWEVDGFLLASTRAIIFEPWMELDVGRDSGSDAPNFDRDAAQIYPPIRKQSIAHPSTSTREHGMNVQRQSRFSAIYSLSR